MHTLARTCAELRIGDRPDLLAVAHKAAGAVRLVAQRVRGVKAVLVVYFTSHHRQLLVSDRFIIFKSLRGVSSDRAGARQQHFSLHLFELSERA